MQPIGREGGGGSVQRGRSVISTIALLSLVEFSRSDVNGCPQVTLGGYKSTCPGQSFAMDICFVSLNKD